ncbi:hypothetical protein ACFS5M_07050 [Lacinutrix iliipiscaria]|uniref:Uncharacterized protein n=1 Tax=Lacinutrix iliipiscaria TaxID=1230532 RepID=A0ABW5WL72_9FLAO
MKKLFTIINLMLVFFSYSQNDKPFRNAFELNIVADLENNYTMKVDSTPYFVKEKILQIYPSERILVEVEIKKDTIYSMKVVKENLNPERTIEIEFSQNAEDRNNITMILNVKNPFDRILYHNAGMYTPKHDYWKATSIIPIKPKLQNFETWPHSIITLVLDNWRFKE